MKKLSLAVLVLGSLSAGIASANNGDVQFIGSVTDVTCNISPFVNGVAKSTIDLGTMKIDGTGAKAVDFSLVPDSQICLDKLEASVGWQSAGFNPTGLANMKGDATGASIKLTAVNSTTPNDSVTSSKQTIPFGDAAAANGIGEFKFQAELAKDTGATATPGTVISSATYSVAYK